MYEETSSNNTFLIIKFKIKNPKSLIIIIISNQTSHAASDKKILH